MSEGVVNPRRVVIVGTGYVGLPAALLLAKAGHQVVGVDIDKNVVQAINDGVLRIDESELQALMNDPAVRANLHARNEPVPAEVFILAVPTPLEPLKKIADLTHVIGAVQSLLGVLKRGDLIIVESTVPPLTCRNIITPLIEAATNLKVGEDVHLAHCPERILPGDVFYEIVHNDRVIGSASEEGRKGARELYASFVEGQLIETDDVTAEVCKLMENTYRDVNLALANEFAAVAESLGIDGRAAIALANQHPRVDILAPGIGVGGHCIPIDPWFIKEVDPENSKLIATARSINDAVPGRVAASIRAALADIERPRIVALGITYKPDTADLRESPAVQIVGLLRRDGYDVTIHDPIVPEHTQGGSLADIAAGADCLVVLVPHKAMIAELEQNDELIRAGMRHPVVLRF